MASRARNIYDSQLDVLRESIMEQTERLRNGEINREQLLEELAFLSEHYQASIYVTEWANNGEMNYDRARLESRPKVTVREVAER